MPIYSVTLVSDGELKELTLKWQSDESPAAIAWQTTELARREYQSGPWYVFWMSNQTMLKVVPRSMYERFTRPVEELVAQSIVSNE